MKLYNIVGIKHAGMLKFVSDLPNGEPITLMRDYENKFDKNAVAVAARGERIGFIKAEFAAELAPKMDAIGQAAMLVKMVRQAGWPYAEIPEDQDRPKPVVDVG